MRTLSVAVSVFVLGCGGAAPTGSTLAAGFSGEFEGADSTTVVIDTPTGPRESSEAGRARIRVLDAGNTVRIELGSAEGQTECTIEATRNGASLTIHAGQRCASQDPEAPFEVQFTGGTGFVSARELTLDLSSRVDAEAGGVRMVARTRYHFEGVRIGDGGPAVAVAPASCDGPTLPSGACFRASNTTWQLDAVLPRGGPISLRIRFEAGGAMIDGDTSDETAGDDTWRLDGTNLEFVFNDFARYRGHIESPELVRGSARNDEGETWQFELRHVAGDPPLTLGGGGTGIGDPVVERALPGARGCAQLGASCFVVEGTRFAIHADFGGGPGTVEVEFAPGGRLIDRDPNDATRDDDTWSQTEDRLEFSFNGGYATYRTVLTSDRLIGGQAENEVGDRWTWTAERVP